MQATDQLTTSDHVVSLGRATAAALQAFQRAMPGSSAFRAAETTLDRCELAFVVARPDTLAGALYKLSVVARRLRACAADAPCHEIALALAHLARAVRKLKAGKPDAMAALRWAARAVDDVPWSDGAEPGFSSCGHAVLCCHLQAVLAGLSRPRLAAATAAPAT